MKIDALEGIEFCSLFSLEHSALSLDALLLSDESLEIIDAGDVFFPLKQNNGNEANSKK